MRNNGEEAEIGIDTSRLPHSQINAEREEARTQRYFRRADPITGESCKYIVSISRNSKISR